MRSAKHIDAVIRRHLKLFRKSGVASVRPGYECRGGLLTHEPAIVVGVERKKKRVSKAQALPKSIDGIPVDVRELSKIEALRAMKPKEFAKRLAGAPDGDEPAALQYATVSLERNLRGHLVAPIARVALAAARSKTQAMIKSNAKPTKAVYQKLPAAVLAPVTGKFRVTCAASPDDGWPTLRSFLQSTLESLTVGMYEFTAPWIVRSVTASLKNKRLNLVLDDPPYDTEMRNQTESQTLAQLEKKIAKGLNFAWAAEAMDPHCSVHLFPSAYHIKAAVKDRRSLWLSSGNWNQTNQPNIMPITKPSQRAGAAGWDRDWHVIVENARVATVFEAAILRDLAQAKPGQRSASSKAGTVPRVLSGKPISTFFKAKTVTGVMTIQPVLTPDNYGDVIIPLILSAKKSFWMQTQYIHPGASFEKDMQKPLASRSILERLISALAAIQSTGVDVKIILGQTVTASQLEVLQMYGQIDATSFRIQDNVHNKGMIIDSKTVVIGSQNWSTEGVDTNRDASVVIRNPVIAAYWEQIFLRDWNERTEAPDRPAT